MFCLHFVVELVSRAVLVVHIVEYLVLAISLAVDAFGTTFLLSDSRTGVVVKDVEVALTFVDVELHRGRAKEDQVAMSRAGVAAKSWQGILRVRACLDHLDVRVVIIVLLIGDLFKLLRLHEHITRLGMSVPLNFCSYSSPADRVSRHSRNDLEG